MRAPGRCLRVKDAVRRGLVGRGPLGAPPRVPEPRLRDDRKRRTSRRTSRGPGKEPRYSAAPSCRRRGHRHPAGCEVLADRRGGRPCGREPLSPPFGPLGLTRRQPLLRVALRGRHPPLATPQEGPRRARHPVTHRGLRARPGEAAAAHLALVCAPRPHTSSSSSARPAFKTQRQTHSRTLLPNIHCCPGGPRLSRHPRRPSAASSHAAWGHVSPRPPGRRPPHASCRDELP